MTLPASGIKICIPAEVAQVVEHGTENAGVDSSSLSLGTTFSPNPRQACPYSKSRPHRAAFLVLLDRLPHNSLWSDSIARVQPRQGPRKETPSGQLSRQPGFRKLPCTSPNSRGLSGRPGRYILSSSSPNRRAPRFICKEHSREPTHQPSKEAP